MAARFRLLYEAAIPTSRTMATCAPLCGLPCFFHVPNRLRRVCLVHNGASKAEALFGPRTSALLDLKHTVLWLAIGKSLCPEAQRFHGPLIQRHGTSGGGNSEVGTAFIGYSFPCRTFVTKAE